MINYKKIFIPFFILFQAVLGMAQQEDYYVRESISEINYLLENAKDYYEDEDIKENNNSVLEIMRELMEEPDAFSINFDSLSQISVLESKDGKLRIFSWNIMFQDMTNKFFGFIQYMNNDQYFWYELKDKTDYEKEKNKYNFHNQWFGAIYYKMIEKKHKGKTIYTLIGWKGKDGLIQQKVIESLEFTHKSLPLFGGKRFKIKNDVRNRIIFNFSAKVQMLLRYNAKQDLIVCDHLAPGKAGMEGHFEYYGPDYSYDAFEFQRGRWFYLSDIDPNKAINYKKNKKVERLKNREPEKEF